MRWALVGIGLLVLLAVPAQAGAGVSVWFLRDGEPVAVPRRVQGPERASAAS